MDITKLDLAFVLGIARVSNMSDFDYDPIPIRPIEPISRLSYLGRERKDSEYPQSRHARASQEEDRLEIYNSEGNLDVYG